MNNEVKVFEDKSLIIAQNLKNLKIKKEKIEEEEKNLKEKLEELLEDYPKITKRKSYIRISVK